MWYVVNPTDNTMEQYRTLITAIKRMEQVGGEIYDSYNRFIVKARKNVC